MKTNNKLRVNTCFWRHHLSTGGWGWVSDLIYKKFNDDNAEMDLHTAYEYQIRDGYLRRPCIAIFHQVVSGYIRSLDNLVLKNNWKYNIHKIIGAITVSRNQSNFLLKHGIKNVSCILHPTPLNVKKWKLDNFLKTDRIIHVGVHCRNLDFFSRLARKQIGGLNYFYIAAKEEVPKTIKKYKIPIMQRLHNEEYNRILTESIVFLQLTSATANNTVLECIARRTPILVNPVDGITDYLGKDYPLYYRNYDEAISLIKKIKHNSNELTSVQNYLDKIRNIFHKNKFIKSLENKINQWL